MAIILSAEMIDPLEAHNEAFDGKAEAFFIAVGQDS